MKSVDCQDFCILNTLGLVIDGIRQSVCPVPAFSLNPVIIWTISEAVLLTIVSRLSSGHTSRQLSALLDHPTGLSGYIGLASGAKSIINQGRLPKPSFTPCNNAAAIFRLEHGFKKMSQLSIETVLGKCCRAYGCHDYSPAAGKITTESHSEMKYQCLLTIGPNYDGQAVTSKAFIKAKISVCSDVELISWWNFSDHRSTNSHLNWWTGREKVGKRTDGIQVVGNAKKCPQKNKEMSISLMLDNIIKAAFSVFIWHKNNTCKSSLKVTVCEKSLFKKQPGSSCPQSSLLHSYKASAPNSNSQSEPSACAGQQGSVVEKCHEKPELQQKHHVTGNQQLK